MAKTYHSIKKEIEELEKRAQELRAKEVAGVVGRIKEAIATYGLSAEDLGLAPRGVTRKTVVAAPKSRKTRGSAATRSPKFRDSAGNTWGGRGPRPRWLREALAAGRKLEEFASR